MPLSYRLVVLQFHPPSNRRTAKSATWILQRTLGEIVGRIVIRQSKAHAKMPDHDPAYKKDFADLLLH